jgi:hypothetical protein
MKINLLNNNIYRKMKLVISFPLSDQTKSGLEKSKKKKNAKKQNRFKNNLKRK